MNSGIFLGSVYATFLFDTAPLDEGVATANASLNGLGATADRTAGQVSESGGIIAGSAPEIASAGGAADAASGGFDLLGGSLMKTLVPLLAMFAGYEGIKTLLASVTSNTNAYNMAQSQITNSLSNSNDEVGLSLAQLDALAESTSANTTATNANNLAAENTLLNYRAIGETVFPLATAQIDNLATALANTSGKAIATTQNYTAAAKQLGKALENPTAGISAFSRVGVTFSADQIAQIKLLQKNGDLIGAQKLLLSDLAAVVGGKATAATETYQGKLAMVEKTMDDMGKGVINTFQIGMEKVGQVLTDVGGFIVKNKLVLDIFAAAILTFTIVALGALIIALGTVIVQSTIFGLIFSPFTAIALIVGAAIGSLVYALGGWNNTVKDAGKVISGVKSGFDTLVQWFKDVYTFGEDAVKAYQDNAGNLKIIADVIGLILLPALAQLVIQSAITGVKMAADGAVAAWGWVSSAAGTAIGWVVSLATTVATSIASATVIAAQGIVAAVSWIAQPWIVAATWATQLAKTIASAIAGAVKIAAQGVIGAAGWIWGAASASAAWVAQFIVIQAKAFWAGLETASPGTAAGLAWAAAAIASSVAWTVTALPLIIAKAAVTATSTALSGIVAAATWVAQPFLIVLAWAAQLALVVAHAISSATSTAANGVVAAATWIAQPVLIALAWSLQMAKVVINGVIWTATMVAQGVGVGLAWSGAALVASLAWVGKMIAMIPFALGWAVGMSAQAVIVATSNVISAGIASAAWIGAAVAAGVAWLLAGGWIIALVAAIVAAFAVAIVWIIQNWNAVGDAAARVWNSIYGIVSGVIGWIEGAWNAVVNWFGGLPGRILGAVGDLGGVLVGAGEAVIGGLWSGMKSVWTNVSGWLGGIGKDIANLKGPLDYDRKLLIPHGNAIMQGLNEGLVAGYSSVKSTVFGMAGQIAGSFGMSAIPAIASTNGSLNDNSGGSNTTNTNFYGTVNVGSNGQDDPSRILGIIARNQDLASRGITSVMPGGLV